MLAEDGIFSLVVETPTREKYCPIEFLAFFSSKKNRPNTKHARRSRPLAVNYSIRECISVKQIILGTAGHIDHGKTSLIKAVTGIDTDRLKEEKERGITIELGFASLDLPGGEHLGIVDVPGHEKFVKNMVAGATGIDIVVMVIAADEGVMPQTREHMEICTLLGVQHGLIALTKTDMVDEEWMELALEDVREFSQGTFLEDSPILPVSSVTGRGIPELIKQPKCQSSRSRHANGH